MPDICRDPLQEGLTNEIDHYSEVEHLFIEWERKVGIQLDAMDAMAWHPVSQLSKCENAFPVYVSCNH